MALSKQDVLPFIRRALKEDEASADITSRGILSARAAVRARIVAGQSGIVAGVGPAAWTFQAVDPSIRVVIKRVDTAQARRGVAILTVEGSARSIFAAERTALNILGHLSGIATLTQQYVKCVRGSPAKIFDTRKTQPGLRFLEKYAVRAGGGHNHRLNLREAVLIKTNHLKALRRTASNPSSLGDGESVIASAVSRARKMYRRKLIEIEVTNLREFRAALKAKPDVILLDNWTPANVRKAVALRTPSSPVSHLSPLLEVSGGITLANVRTFARCGVERISVGRLTHSACSLNVSLEVA